MQCVRGPAGSPADPFLYLEEARKGGQDLPGEFMRQVRSEGSKVVWPSWNDTFRTAIMVLIMTTLLAIFFFAVDLLQHGRTLAPEPDRLMPVDHSPSPHPVPRWGEGDQNR